MGQLLIRRVAEPPYGVTKIHPATLPGLQKTYRLRFLLDKYHLTYNSLILRLLIFTGHTRLEY